MEYEGVKSMQISPTFRSNPHAEIVLFPVTLSERRFVEETDVLQRLSSDIHAESHGSGYFDAPARIYRRRQSVNPVKGNLKLGRVIRTKDGIATDRAIVSEWCDCCNPFFQG